MKGKDVFDEAVAEIYGDRGASWLQSMALEDPTLSQSDLLGDFESNPTCRASFFGRESNLRSVVRDFVSSDNGSLILSVACGSGAEPLELAARLADAYHGDYHIDAIDVSSQVLARAKKGIISDANVNGYSNTLVEMESKGIIKATDGKAISNHNWNVDRVDLEVSEEVRSHIAHEQHDIIDGPYHKTGYDIAFL